MNAANNTSITASIPAEDSRATGLIPVVREERTLSLPPQKADEQGSSSTTLPETILRTWSRIGRANMTVRMYSDLVRIATETLGSRGPRPVRLRPTSLKNFLEFWSRVRDDAAE